MRWALAQCSSPICIKSCQQHHPSLLSDDCIFAFFFSCCSWNAIKIAWISVVRILSFHIVMWIIAFTYFGTYHYTSQAVLNTDTNYYEWSVAHQGHTVNTFCYAFKLWSYRPHIIMNIPDMVLEIMWSHIVHAVLLMNRFDWFSYTHLPQLHTTAEEVTFWHIYLSALDIWLFKPCKCDCDFPCLQLEKMKPKNHICYALWKPINIEAYFCHIRKTSCFKSIII